MAFHLNFHHEIQIQKIQQQRDPLKIGFAALILVGAVLLLFYFFRMQQISGTTKKLAKREQEWAAIAPELEKAKKAEADANPSIKAAEIVSERVNGRFFWAPVLQLLTEKTPETVQFTQILMQAPDAVGPDARFSVQVTGIIAGQEPRIDADGFRVQLEQAFGASYPDAKAEFRQLDDRSEEVEIEGGALSTVLFVIGLDFAAPKIEAPAETAAQPAAGANP